MKITKTHTTVLTLLGTTLLFFVIFKTKDLYFHPKKPINNPKGLEIEVSKENHLDTKTLTVPKLTIFRNEKFYNEQIIQNPDEKTQENEILDGLSNKYLSQVIAQQQMYFTRCYENHLRENPNKESNFGTMLIEILVLPHGEIRDVVVKESNFKDKTFENCIKTVFSRTPIKKFSGEKFYALYPLEFE